MEQSAGRGRGNGRHHTTLILGAACAFFAALCLAIPLYVIRPFRPQAARALALALTVRDLAPWVSGVCAAVAILLLIWSWKVPGLVRRISMVAFSLVSLLCAVLSHINIFEVMFHPYDSPAFSRASEAKLDADDKLLAVTIGGDAHAYPIRTMGYHHIVNDTVAGMPIAVTYCTLCHTGLVWSRSLDGKTLHFRLAGINNGNALIRDEETGSIWQQSTGQSIFGPLKGRALEIVRSDELTFALWKTERPEGQILKPDSRYAAEYDSKDWEKHVEKTHVVIDTRRSGIEPHQLMLGVLAAGQAKAYPLKLMLAEKLIQDQIGDQPLVLVVGPDQASIRVFRAQLAGESNTLAFARTLDTAPGEANIMADEQTGSIWNFQGCAVEGKWVGRCLTQMDANKDYWFDFLNHHPDAKVYRE
jgi:hypothetical protein